MFSIIVPVYNVAPYLRECLDSIFASVKMLSEKGEISSEKSNKNGSFSFSRSFTIEIICVDDGSTDGSETILDEYYKKLSSHSSHFLVHFSIIHQANAGVSVARNTALYVATGEWVQFLDSDDSLKLDFLEKLQEAVNEHSDVDAIEHTAIYCYNDGKQVYGGGRLPPKCVVDAQKILSDPFGKKYTSRGRCSCYKIFRRSVIEETNLRFTPGIPINEDALFVAQFYAFAGKIAICPEIAGYLRISRDNSAIATISSAKLIPRIHGAEVLYATWVSHPSNGLVVRLCAEFIALAYLGRELEKQEAQVCRETVLASHFFQKKGLIFLAQHGTWKMRLFAIVMLVVPKDIQRLLLKRLNCK